MKVGSGSKTPGGAGKHTGHTGTRIIQTNLPVPRYLAKPQARVPRSAVSLAARRQTTRDGFTGFTGRNRCGGGKGIYNLRNDELMYVLYSAAALRRDWGGRDD
jgi:hypothetical protein